QASIMLSHDAPVGVEVEVDARMRIEPSHNVRGRVGRVIVENDMKFSMREPPVDDLEEAEEVSSRMPVRALTDDSSGGDFERRVQAGQPVTPVVVRLPGRQVRSKRQDRLSSLERLDLGLFVQAEDNCISRRFQI